MSIDPDMDERVSALTIALRALAIVPTMKPGVREVVHDGHRCRVCASTWGMGEPEKHQGWCALKGAEQ